MQLREECSQIMNERRIKYGRQYEEPTGTATLTQGYHLPCSYVIHTVGPIVYGELNNALRQDLRNCYENEKTPEFPMERIIFNVYKDVDREYYEEHFA